MSQKEKIPNFFLLPFVVSVTIFYRSAHFISWGARRSFISVFRVMRIFSDPPNIDTPYPHPSSFSSFHLCHLIYMSNKRMNGIHSLEYNRHSKAQNLKVKLLPCLHFEMYSELKKIYFLNQITAYFWFWPISHDFSHFACYTSLARNDPPPGFLGWGFGGLYYCNTPTLLSGAAHFPIRILYECVRWHFLE